jgi:hypothetical protein
VRSTSPRLATQVGAMVFLVGACGSPSSTLPSEANTDASLAPGQGADDASRASALPAPQIDGSAVAMETGAAPSDGSDDTSAACPAAAPMNSLPGGPLFACGRDGTNCSYGSTCCLCEANPSCSATPFWTCASTDAKPPCPPSLPSGYCSTANIGLSCLYCTESGLFRAICAPNGEGGFPWDILLPPPICVAADASWAIDGN